SIPTLSRLLNPNQNLKPQTPNKLNQLIKSLNYPPNPLPTPLPTKPTTTLPLIIPHISNLYYSQLPTPLQDIPTMYKYHSIISNSHNHPQ
ncbi:helix-turn-helix domain-containing protein, partial [Staphylococcus epidermidis]